MIRPAVRAVRSAFLLEGHVRAIVHALKYRGWHSIGVPIAGRMAAAVQDDADVKDLDVVVPVPLSAARLRQRGYNQAAALAAPLATVLGLPFAGDILEKRPRADSQTTLHPAERRANVAGAFWVDDRRVGPLLARHVVLVDDVWTTGATSLACADALLRAGARAITVATFARALPELERHDRRIEQMVIP